MFQSVAIKEAEQGAAEINLAKQVILLDSYFGKDSQ